MFPFQTFGYSLLQNQTAYSAVVNVLVFLTVTNSRIQQTTKSQSISAAFLLSYTFILSLNPFLMQSYALSKRRAGFGPPPLVKVYVCYSVFRFFQRVNAIIPTPLIPRTTVRTKRGLASPVCGVFTTEFAVLLEFPASPPGVFELLLELPEPPLELEDSSVVFTVASQVSRGRSATFVFTVNLI